MKLSFKKRNSSLEILRIIAIFFIIVSHYSVHGGFENVYIYNNSNNYLLNFLVLGNLGVNIFALLSGYFGIKSTFNFRKVFSLQFSVLFYSILFYIFFLLIDFKQFNFSSIIKFVFPTTFNTYWFFTAYIILYLISPYINKLLKSISRKKHLILISFLLLIWSFIRLFTNQEMYSNGLMDLSMLYIVGAYLQLYPDNLLNKMKIYNYLILINIVLLPLSTVLMTRIFENGETYFYSRHSILIISLAVGLLLYFSNLNIKENIFINQLASTSFGVYLIHEHPYVREYIWLNLFKNYKYANSNILIFHMIITVTTVFLVASLIELIRKNILEPTVLRFYDSIVIHMESKPTLISTFLRK